MLKYDTFISPSEIIQKQTALTFLTSSIFFSLFLGLVVGETNYDGYCFVQHSCVFSYKIEVSDNNALVAERLSPDEVPSHTHLEGRELQQKQKSVLNFTLTIRFCRQGSVASLSFVISVYVS